MENENAYMPAFVVHDASATQGLGLNKREYIAALVLQGIMANSIPGSHHCPDESVREAIQRTDMLLDKLSDTRPLFLGLKVIEAARSIECKCSIVFKSGVHEMSCAVAELKDALAAFDEVKK